MARRRIMPLISMLLGRAGVAARRSLGTDCSERPSTRAQNDTLLAVGGAHRPLGRRVPRLGSGSRNQAALVVAPAYRRRLPRKDDQREPARWVTEEGHVHPTADRLLNGARGEPRPYFEAAGALLFFVCMSKVSFRENKWQAPGFWPYICRASSFPPGLIFVTAGALRCHPEWSLHLERAMATGQPQRFQDALRMANTPTQRRLVLGQEAAFHLARGIRDQDPAAFASAARFYARAR